ncbi:uncharacterized protein B0H64DRAFT_425088 [Chaetomium fimeti]|uniref:Alpha/beta hydrolase fold-3 domain-containing protein n=1 Tax=Chaetomium fimeti TaxID=1854472 RepID=A0AAE0HCQ5_9PEZI|nr:hypothetical protein B0H64DRAFT_425088 [Chaetomium fimeti]
MPNYEPTPRRFSTVSVPRSSSRKNSVDATIHPAVGYNSTLHDHPPVDLADALQHLQHVELESEQERGRTRQSGGDNARRTIPSHNGLPTSLSAQRESSASTRERIAVWEARSRSQSKSRSKSRGGDAGSKHRISVVPEVPDLALAFSAFRPQEATPGDGTLATGQFGMESNPDSCTEDGSRPNKGQEEVSTTVVEARPQTPVYHSGETAMPPTPETTPKLSSSTRNIHHRMPTTKKPTEGNEGLSESTAPATPPRKSNPTTMIMPLTPEATPEREGNSLRGRSQARSYPLEAEGPLPSRSVGYMAVYQPETSRSPVRMDDGTVTQLHPRYHLPSDLLYDESPQHNAPQAHTAVSQGPVRQADAPLDQAVPGPEMESRYHNVWRINSYQPDFPLPDRPSNYVDIHTLSQERFEGNPLQQVPRGQLPAEPRNPDGAGLESYPFPRLRESGGRDWVVDIPPSPSTAYFAGDQGIRPPQSPSRSRGREQYTARNEVRRHEWDAPSVIERALHAASVSMIQGLNVPVGVYRGLRDMYYPAPSRPDIVKAYPIRPRLPIRIFFPCHHDLTSPALLPTLLTIHGGAFTVGTPADDDPWNRTFADSYTVLVIALNYAKAPWAAFPAPLLDTEALYHAILNDESLPIDRMRVALAGFDAGANLALALSQLPSPPQPPQPPPQPLPSSTPLQPPTHRHHLHNGHPRLHHPAAPKTGHPPLQAHPPRPARLGPRARLDGARAAAVGRVELHPLRARRGRRAGVARVGGARGPAAARLCGGGGVGLSGHGELGGGVSVGREGCAGRWGEGLGRGGRGGEYEVVVGAGCGAWV